VEFASVDEVEDLHHDERVEYKGEMSRVAIGGSQYVIVI
jgi:hypothetical protein